MAAVKVILMEDIAKLGRRGEVREVAAGYARNYLLPKRLAVPATAANLRDIDRLKRQREQDEVRQATQARALAARIEALALTVPMQASEEGRLYGSVAAHDVIEFLVQHEISVERRRVGLEEPIKALGEYTVPIRLSGEITASLKVTVVRG
ncbi:MAG: 50S ribosomal protein L9 [Candidatus Rokubacteria bacterium]|nr:50S ribosomal protein L9 [Candidatus Rokubacteria bacterium]